MSPLAPPPAAHQARSEDLSLHPTSQPPAAQTSPCPAPSWAHFRRKRKLEASAQHGAEKGTQQRSQLSPATRQIHNMGLSGQIKSLQRTSLGCVQHGHGYPAPSQVPASPCRTERSLCLLWAWASPLPVAVGVSPGAPHITALPSPPVRAAGMSEPRKMGPVWACRDSERPTTGKSQR